MSQFIKFYFTSFMLNMFWTLIHPSSGACDCSVELPHWSYCSWFDVCWSFGVVGLEWYPCCRLQFVVNPGLGAWTSTKLCPGRYEWLRH